MEFKFDPNQPYQKEAIAAVVDLFKGQPRDASILESTLTSHLTEIGNQYLLDIVN